MPTGMHSAQASTGSTGYKLLQSNSSSIAFTHLRSLNFNSQLEAHPSQEFNTSKPEVPRIRRDVPLLPPSPSWTPN
jgi:hypothetical protein